MAPEFSIGLTPDQIRRAEFRTSLRGLDSSEVRDFLEKVAGVLEEVLATRERMAERLGEHADRDLKDEFEDIGREVTAILQTAREAAEAMRERASLDAARWRAESMADAEQARTEARSDAEALRGDAWATGTELLNQVLTELKNMREEAEREVLTITGEAEREAHRLTSAARREAEDLARHATMDAEKMTSEAMKRRDEIIEQAHRQAAAAEERTRALEERREELLEELEVVRSTLGRLEGTLEQRREDMDLSASEPSNVRVVTPELGGGESKTWALGETVRIIPPEDDAVRGRDAVREGDVVRERHATPVPEPDPRLVRERPEPEPAPPTSEPEAQPSTVRDGETEPAGTPAEPETPPAEPATPRETATDDIEALFAALRGGDREDQGAAASPLEGPAPATQEESPLQSAPAPATPTEDWLEQRDSRLLPVTNRALRGIKKAVTDAQNLALDSLRTDPDWIPDAEALAEEMQADLKGLWGESFAAGHAVAEQMVAGRLKRPSTPRSTAAKDFGEELAAAVQEALLAAGDGQRERQSATSRIFRAWRTDEAERRIRALAISGYHLGIIKSAAGKHQVDWVPSGTLCTACREASRDPGKNPPPVHPGCECTLVAS